MADLTIPSTMRAWQYNDTNGGIEKALKLNPKAPLPSVKSSQHLVKVIAVALNPVDYKPAEIPGVGRFAISKPATPCVDFAGVIVKPAQGSALKAGQLMYGASAYFPFAGGALREYTVTNDKAAVPLSKGVTALQGATVAIAGITAYQSIVPHVKQGDSIFINGGSGGTGVFGIQIAKASGLHVTTTCSTPNVDLCKSLGADAVIDYRKENVVEALKASGRKFDHAVDNVGTSTELIWRNTEYLKPEKKLVIVGGEVSLARLGENIKRKLLPTFLGGLKGHVVGFWPKQIPQDLAQIGTWIGEGKIKPLIDQEFKFEDAPKAFERLKTGRAKGKIVVVVDPAEKDRTG